MKKKQNPRAEREARKAAQKQKYAKPVQPQETAPAQPAAGNDNAGKPIKSRNKAAGLKSTLAAGNALYLTSFGKGNKAVTEYRIRTDAGYTAEPVAPDTTLSVKSANECGVSFSGSRIASLPDTLLADNPMHTAAGRPGADNLGLKDALETHYYGRTFDDSLHIQIIYNILDIEKILAVHVANAAAAIDHLGDEYANAETEDFIGYMSTRNTYAVYMNPALNQNLSKDAVQKINASRTAFENLLKTNRLGYFGLDIPRPNPRKNAAVEKRNEEIKKRLYHLVAMVGSLRQWCFHSIRNIAAWPYDLKNGLEPEYLDTLDYYFNGRFDKINEEFLQTNTMNLQILQKAFPEDDAAELTGRYYRFIVLKDQKNLGFSVTKLREMMLDRAGAFPLTDQSMDSVRSKLYKLLDFTLFRHFERNPEQAEKMVRKLRAAMTESEKEQIYSNRATALWQQYAGLFVSFGKTLGRLNEAEAAAYHSAGIVDAGVLSGQYRQSSSISYFAKLIYALCLFLDGKEINDLLTSLINKFDNIKSLTECTHDLHIYTPFSGSYAFFENCGQYVEEMRLVKNIARMTRPIPAVKRTMFRDALDILGVPADMTEEQFEQELDICLTSKKQNAKANTVFRNFIINNVLESSRFIYVVRFCNPKAIGSIAKNKNLTEFVLNGIPETQIDRYLTSCIEHADRNGSKKQKIQQLTDMLAELDFGMFREVSQKPAKQREKERFKAIIGLYLTVIYLVVKNLVNVNARYVMAFHCVERDAGLYGNPLKNKQYAGLVRTLLAEGTNSRSRYLARNRHQRDCIAQNLKNTDQYALDIKEYRNKVAHLTFIRTCDQWLTGNFRFESYFGLYHYIAQNALSGITDAAKKQGCPYYTDLQTHRSYVKDWVKALNVPFGYNTPRFKNLTIEDLFDRNNPPETATE